MKYPLTFCLLIWALPVAAAELHVRDNDRDVMFEVSSVECEKLLTFADDQKPLNGQGRPNDYATEFDGITWGSTLAGMTQDCVGRNSALRGSSPGNVTTPSVPLDAQGVGFSPGAGFIPIHTSVVAFPVSSPNVAGEHVLVGFGACGPVGFGSIAFVLDRPRTALCIDFQYRSFDENGRWTARGDCTVGDRIHVEFWGADGSHIGHQDVVDGGVLPTKGLNERTCHQQFCWESEVPVAAITTWGQNTYHAWDSLCLGSAVEPEPEPEPVDVCLDRCAELCGICAR